MASWRSVTPVAAIDFVVGAQGVVAVALTACSLGRAVEEGLTYKFHAVWSSVLQLLCVFFEVCGRQAHPVMKKVSWVAPGARAGSSTWAFGLWAPRRGLCLCYHFNSTHCHRAHSR